MTLDEQDVLNAALNRLHTANICLGSGYTEGRAFEGALFIIDDVKDTLENLLKAPASDIKAARSVKIVNF
jgi:hypothetical protein